MKAILKFNLEDCDDNRAHMRCVKALDMASALFDIAHNNKNLDKEQVLEKIADALLHHGIDLEELID